MKLLLGKTILITGATGGLGEAVTAAFVEAGAFVAASARKVDSSNPAQLAVPADLTTAEGAEAAVRTVLEARGQLDGVVHVLGGFATDGETQDTSEQTWDKMFALNTRAPFLVFRAALKPMRAAGRGRIIAIGSRAGETAPAGLSAYAASKAALDSLVQVIAAENKFTGITANVVMPSTIDTAANRAAMPDADFTRWVKPDSIAGLLVWLASDASADVSGALIPVYGKA
ncbi:SDR family oxidoreductase [Paludibaculum fermentans]|uniref:SDR family oxidoreductase n=1 Tax=Paludibaculum fermentans TaxID=1473598 RepID=A0A7S7NT00_PALFE|nr:SDR family NAD(P)-dependent oxidoreductase [Paludibaculum fermentans]QOY89156.1 SDR family oxidoreductase [Paludibaculum fermentans]